MKNYVDELPKSCEKCKFYECETELVGEWGMENHRHICKINGSLIQGICPLQSLADHDKQVREEVVDEIKEKFNDTIKHHFCPNPSSVDFITLCISEVEEFLDQMKGKNNVKD